MELDRIGARPVGSTHDNVCPSTTAGKYNNWNDRGCIRMGSLGFCEPMDFQNLCWRTRGFLENGLGNPLMNLLIEIPYVTPEWKFTDI